MQPHEMIPVTVNGSQYTIVTNTDGYLDIKTALQYLAKKRTYSREGYRKKISATGVNRHKIVRILGDPMTTNRSPTLPPIPTKLPIPAMPPIKLPHIPMPIPVVKDTRMLLVNEDRYNYLVTNLNKQAVGLSGNFSMSASTA